MDELEKKEHKDRIRIFNITRKLIIKHIEKYCKGDSAAKITEALDLATTFLGNFSFMMFTEDATKQEHLAMIELVNKLLQDWYTNALNEIDFTNQRKILQ